MSIQRIVLRTNLKELLANLQQIGVPIELCDSPPPDYAEDLFPDPTCLSVFAFSACSEEMLRHMAKHAGNSENFLAFLCRPSSGFLSCEENNGLGKITLLSPENIASRAMEKTLAAIAHHALQ